MDPAVFRHLHDATCGVTCSSCHLRAICLPAGLSRLEVELLDKRLVASRRKVRRGECLYRAGDRFDSVFAIWTGFFKTCMSSADGREQVTGFQMGGELLGLDGIGAGQHEVDAIALEDSQVCVIRFDAFEALVGEVGSLQRLFHRRMSRELVRHQSALLLLGSMHAEERLAAFLLNLVRRLQALGFSETAVTLRMTREEIGSFLGLSLETVSRTFSKLQAQGLLLVRNRQVRITDAAALQQLVDGVEQERPVPRPAPGAAPAMARWIAIAMHGMTRD